MGLYVLVVFFQGGRYFPILVFEEFLGDFLMVFLKAIHKLEGHTPGFFGVGAKVFLFAFLGEFELPSTFGSPFFFEEIPSGVSEFFFGTIGPFFHEFFKRFISYVY